jgi:hypothetical protein
LSNELRRRNVEYHRQPFRDIFTYRTLSGFEQFWRRKYAPQAELVELRLRSAPPFSCNIIQIKLFFIP